MDFFKKTIKLLILLPNLPFLIVLSIYLLVNIYKHTGVVEMEFINHDDLADKVKDHINHIYPQHLRYAVSVVIYGWVLLNTI